MSKILGATAGQISVGDSFMIAGTKIVLERLLAKFVGNGSLISGGVKLGGAFAVKKFMGGKISDVVSTALTVDGAEDLVSAFIPKISGGLFGNSDVQVDLI
jgi:hypothetical protein